MNKTQPILFLSAVRLVADEFSKMKKAFSAHDVTKALRAKSNEGEIDIVDITETESVPTISALVKKIDHAKVRDAVISLYEAGELAGYRKGYGRTPQGSSYVEYQFDTAGLVPPVQATATPVPVSAAIADRIFQYCLGRLRSGYLPTIKNIQSTLRRDGNFTCTQILDVMGASTKHSYNIRGGMAANNHSKATVLSATFAP